MLLHVKLLFNINLDYITQTSVSYSCIKYSTSTACFAVAFNTLQDYVSTMEIDVSEK